MCQKYMYEILCTYSYRLLGNTVCRKKVLIDKIDQKIIKCYVHVLIVLIR